MTDAAPERITLARKIGSTEWLPMPKGETMSMGYVDCEKYIRLEASQARLDTAHNRAAQYLQRAVDAEAALTTAQARIAELEAALRGCIEELETTLHSERDGVWEKETFDAVLDPFRRALEAKP